MVRRILPQMSSSQLAVPASSNSLNGCEAEAFGMGVEVVVVVVVVEDVVVVPAGRVPEVCFERVPWAVTPTVGNSCARASLTTATACRQAASDCLSVWFETSICFSRSLSVASSYTDHQSLPLAASRGSAGFQPSASLKRCGTGADGRW
jgi:hypothetical protein